MIRLYDTSQRQKTELQAYAEGKLGVYVCGPTVYDMCHVGHARCYVAFDVVIRHLRARGFDVNYVRNLTDVDDKIIKRAADNDEDPLALSARCVDAFHVDMAALGNLEPDIEPKVSEHIEEIVGLIERILEAGHAYQVEGDVFFSVDSFPAYGGLSRRNLDELRAGERVEVDERKRNPFDFALWKQVKPGEPSWPSPWGKGRPGWHIECSAMSSRYLGERFEIHGGGMDLIFPHHENEMAQSRSVFGAQTFARHWMHNGFINVRTAEDEEKKMSKSEGNFFTIQEVIKQHEPEALRLFLLGTHYRNPITFEVEAAEGGGTRYVSLEDAERRLAYTYSTLSRLEGALAQGKDPGAGEVLAPAADFAERFDAALDDDFNTAAALGLSSELLTLANKLLDQPKSASKPVRRRTLQAIRSSLDHVRRALGIFGQAPQAFLERRRSKLCASRGIDAGEVTRSIARRTEARKQKDFAGADAIRDELARAGVELMDAPGGTSWRVTE